eukprot:9000746-Pyramimonas_sp.AAC.1
MLPVGVPFDVMLSVVRIQVPSVAFLMVVLPFVLPCFLRPSPAAALTLASEQRVVAAIANTFSTDAPAPLRGGGGGLARWPSLGGSALLS